jgi:hypothetical protein
VWRLREEGRAVEHIILLGLRGTPDSAITRRLKSEELLFLTQDQEFLELRLTRSAVIISRVTQSLPLGVRLEAWVTAIREYFSSDWSEKLFEVFDDGKLRAWADVPSDS